MRIDPSTGEAALRAPLSLSLPLPVSLSASLSASLPAMDADAAPGGPPAIRAPQDVLSGVRVASQLLQDFRPITESIEWELGHLHWAQAGLLTFAENEVPYVVNNSGRLSEDAAALLFHHCADTAPQGAIAVLELGAGCGLFARMFLQAFRHLCQQEGRDFDQRLVYYVTDGSPRTVAQWQERALFAEFGGQVVAGRCDAMRPEAVQLPDGSTVPLPPLHAVFCNYVLDVLPATVVRRQGDGPVQELRIRTRLTDDAQLVRQYTALSPGEIRALVDHADAAQRARLLPLVGLFEQEVGFFDCDQAALSPWVDAALSVSEAAPRLLVNHGAFGALQTLQRRLAPKGLVLINDYGACTPEAAAQAGASQRFGRTSAIGLNFPLLAQLFGREGWQVLAPSGDAQRAIHARLLIGEGCERTAAAFLNRFSADAQQFFEAPAHEARMHLESGRQDAALESYRQAITRSPRDWRLLGEVAEFVGLQLRDFAAGIELARSALDLNPWLSTWLWNVLGDCLFCQEQFAAAHEAYLQAEGIDPRDARTQLNLAYTWQQRGDPARALACIAQGLAGDAHGVHTQRLMEKQQQILAQIAALRASEQQRLAQRAARLQGGA